MKATRTCQDCWYYRRVAEGTGTCHRHPPRPRTILDPDSDGHGLIAMWPQVEDEDFCGEHLPRIRKDDNDE